MHLHSVWVCGYVNAESLLSFISALCLVICKYITATLSCHLCPPILSLFLSPSLPSSILSPFLPSFHPLLPSYSSFSPPPFHILPPSPSPFLSSLPASRIGTPKGKCVHKVCSLHDVNDWLCHRIWRVALRCRVRRTTKLTHTLNFVYMLVSFPDLNVLY